MAESRFPLIGTRLVSAAVLVPVALAAVFVGMPWFGFLAAFLAVLMAREWAELCLAGAGARALWRPRPPAGAVVLVVAVAVAAGAALVGSYTLSLALAVLGAAAVWTASPGGTGRDRALMAFGVLYVILTVAALLWLRDDPDFGRETVFGLLGIVWATDSGAYLAGRLIGGPRLAPVTSPNKTWAGLLGGVAAAAGLSAAAAAVLGFGAPWRVVAAGVGVSLVAQAGDLLESAVKRHFAVKDSGAIIPGHGGLFDRLDGLLTAAPATAVAFLIADGGGFLWQ